MWFAAMDLADIGNTLAYPFYWLISGLITVLHKGMSFIFGYESGVSWLLAIVLMTCVLRSLMIPLYFKQMNASRAMTAIQPEMTALREKYPNDRERQSVEMMKLYEQNGVSPYASCLPMLVQMPVFMCVFWVINGVSGRGNVHGYWFETNPDLVHSFQNATVFGVRLIDRFWPITDFGATQILSGILILAMTGVLFYQQLYMMQRNMPPTVMEGAMGMQQKMMLYVMPLMYITGGVNMPVGVLFYWLMSNIWTMGQQWIMVRRYPTPGTPAYIDWEDRMIADGKDPKVIAAERMEKARSKKSGSSLSSKMVAQAREAETQHSLEVMEANASGSERSAIVRTDETTGKKIVVRAQPTHRSRSKRKK